MTVPTLAAMAALVLLHNSDADVGYPTTEEVDRSWGFGPFATRIQAAARGRTVRRRFRNEWVHILSSTSGIQVYTNNVILEPLRRVVWLAYRFVMGDATAATHLGVTHIATRNWGERWLARYRNSAEFEPILTPPYHIRSRVYAALNN